MTRLLNAALGNKEEAQALLDTALPAMMMQADGEFEATGEAMFYRALLQLDKATSAAEVQATTKELVRVGSWVDHTAACFSRHTYLCLFPRSISTTHRV